MADDSEPLNPKLIDDVRSAIEDLTPTVSDYVGQSQDLAERHWNEHMKRMADAGAVGGAMAGQLISGCSIWRNSRETSAPGPGSTDWRVGERKSPRVFAIPRPVDTRRYR